MAGGALAGPAAPAVTQAAGVIGSLGRAAIRGSTRSGVGELAAVGAGSAAGDASAVAGQSSPSNAKLMGRRGRGPGGSGSGLTSQTLKQLQSSQASLQKIIAEHLQKLADYKADPFSPKNDNLGLLRNAPSKAIQEKIIAGRIEVLEKQIAKQKGELAKVDTRIEELNRGTK